MIVRQITKISRQLFSLHGHYSLYTVTILREETVYYKLFEPTSVVRRHKKQNQFSGQYDHKILLP